MLSQLLGRGGGLARQAGASPQGLLPCGAGKTYADLLIEFINATRVLLNPYYEPPRGSRLASTELPIVMGVMSTNGRTLYLPVHGRGRVAASGMSHLFRLGARSPLSTCGTSSCL